MQHKIENFAHERREECAEAEFSNLRDASQVAASPPAAITQRRGTPRFKVELDVSLNSEHNFYVGFVENMSADGVFIATHILKKVGNTLELYIHLPNSDVVVQGLGEVRWVRDCSEQSNIPPGMGVRFLHLEPGCQEKVTAFLATREPMYFDDD